MICVMLYLAKTKLVIYSTNKKAKQTQLVKRQFPCHQTAWNTGSSLYCRILWTTAKGTEKTEQEIKVQK